MSKETILSYIAGFVDGEGYIGIRIDKGTNHYGLRINITNTNLFILEWIQEQLNCGGCIYGNKRQSIKHKLSYKLEYGHKQAGKVLLKLLPYLRLKQPQAKIGLQLRDTFKPIYDVKGITLELLKQRKLLKDKIDLLNKRGPR